MRQIQKIGLLICFLLFTAGCSSTATEKSSVLPEYTGAANSLPITPTGSADFSGPHSVASANNYVCGSFCCNYSETGTQVANSTAQLNGTDGMCWVMYQWSGLDINNRPEQLTFDIDGVNTEYWIGVSDYSIGTWKITGPFSQATTDYAYPDGDYISPGGNTYIVFIADEGHALTINWINLVTSLGADRIHVDPGYSGTEVGTPEQPFNTIDEAVAVAQDGAVVVLAPGFYEVSTNITLPRAITIEGAGACRTEVTGGFFAAAPAGTQPTTINGISCGFVRYDYHGETVAPLRIQHSTVLFLSIGYPALHDVVIDNCMIRGDEDQDGNISVHDESFNVSEDRVVIFNHGEAEATNIVKNCEIHGGIRFASGNLATHIATGNTVYGSIEDNSGACYTTISHNHVIGGSIRDSSGGFYEGEEEEFIEYNTVVEGIIESRGASASVRYNTITCTSIPEIDGELAIAGLSAMSGGPAYICGNHVTVPYVEVPDLVWWEIEDEFCALRNLCGPGYCKDNVLNGGGYGLLDLSGSSDTSGNQISGAHFGVMFASAADFKDNIIEDCVADGLIVDSVDNVFSGNIIRNNGGDGVRIQRADNNEPPDFGGGASECEGNNCIYGNTGYGMRIEMLASDAPTVFARNNFWGVTTETEIATFCIIDSTDEGTLATVDFMPFLVDLP